MLYNEECFQYINIIYTGKALVSNPQPSSPIRPLASMTIGMSDNNVLSKSLQTV